MEGLMCMDPLKRLGNSGIDEVKKHPFFNGIEWDSLLVGPGPFFTMVATGKDEQALMHPKQNEKDEFLSEVIKDQMNFVNYDKEGDFKDFDDTCWLTLKKITEIDADRIIKRDQRRKAKASKAK